MALQSPVINQPIVSPNVLSEPPTKLISVQNSGSFDAIASSHADFVEDSAYTREAEVYSKKGSFKRVKQKIKKHARSLKGSFGRKKSFESSDNSPSQKGSFSELAPLTPLTLVSPVKTKVSPPNTSPPKSYSPPPAPILRPSRSIEFSLDSCRSSESTGSPFVLPRSFGFPKPPTMDVRQSSSSLLDRGAPSRRQQLGEQKARTHQMAVNEEKFIRERMRKKGKEHLFPEYRFVDFIGKGTYGRVFQAHDYTVAPSRDVAIKIMNIDDVDYEATAVEKDQSIEDVRQEIQILTQLRELGARNVNQVYDTFEVDGQLWIVCEYCAGGSLRTLLRATKNRCDDEVYIKIIARELAIGLQAIHEAHIIHRDLKAANVMIHEQGGLQIIDFGVAGAVESKLDKRGTIIGTPNWMPPEQLKSAFNQSVLKYGFEVDIWSYIATIYEITTGSPPHAGAPQNRLFIMMRSNPPRLSEEQYSKELCDFIEFVAQTDPELRPTINQILEHPFIHDTEQSHPVGILKDLVDKFVDWSFTGGQRTSLFMPSGAQAASEFASGNSDDLDFIFSTSHDLKAEFDQSHDPSADPPDDIHNLPSLEIDSLSASPFPQSLDNYAMDPPEFTARPSIFNKPSLDLPDNDPTHESRVVRGGQALGALFDANQDPYEYGVRSGNMPLDRPILSRAKSDLPLRNNDDASDLARKELDYYESSGSKSDVELADADTIKSKRKKDKRETMNMGWQPEWGDIEDNTASEAETMRNPPPAFPLARPSLIHAETAPDKVAMARASIATINLDDLMGDDDDWQARSALALPDFAVHSVEDEDITITRHNITDLTDSEYQSYPSSLADTSASEDESYISPRAFPRQSTFGSTDQEHPNMWADVAPPNMATMRDDAPPEVVTAELKRLINDFTAELGAIRDEMPKESDLAYDFEGDSEDDEVERGASKGKENSRFNVS